MSRKETWEVILGFTAFLLITGEERSGENACEPKTASVPRAMPSTSFFRCIVFDGVLTVFFHKECKHPET